MGEVPPLPAEVETACFRVAQEALTNVLRHAHAKQVWVDVGLRDGALELPAAVIRAGAMATAKQIAHRA